MSLRYVSRVVVQGGARAAQGIRDHASRSIKDTATSSTSSAAAAANSNRARRISAARSNLKAASAAGEEKLRRAEEDLRTVMFLSCWGPN